MFTADFIVSNLVVFVATDLASSWFSPSQPACPGCSARPTRVEAEPEVQVVRVAPRLAPYRDEMVSGPSHEWALVLYSIGGRSPTLLWHQRRILGEVAPTDGTDHGHLYAILTPDGDVCLGDYSGRDSGVAAVRFATTRQSLPPGVPGPQTYRFRE